MPPRILVTGSGGPAGRALLTALVDRGVAVVGVDMAPSRTPGLEVAIEAVPAATEGAFLPVLLDVARRHRVDLIVPTVSEELPALAQLAALRPNGPCIVVAAPHAVAIAHDKWCTALTLADAGLAVPRSALPSVVSPAARGRILGLPYLSKPRCGRGGRGVAIHSRDGGDDRALRDDHVLQEYIPGVEYSVDLYLGGRGDDDIAVVLRKVALAHGSIGNATEVCRDHLAVDVARVAIVAAHAIGLTGPADIDIRRRADGTPVVLEINARFGAHSAHAPELVDALLRANHASAAA
jgi:carbamoyl-phosphate synthase large subunit